MSKGPKHVDDCAVINTDIDQEQLCSCGAYDRWREELRKEGWRKLPSAQEKDGKLIANGLSWVYVGRDVYVRWPVKELVDRFLAWQLPQSVCSDLCVTDPKYKFPRSGTCLLTADEARQMFEHLFAKPL